MTPPLRAHDIDPPHVAGRSDRFDVAAEHPAGGVVVRPATRADHATVSALLRDLELGWPGLDLASFVVAEVHGEVVGIAELRRFGGHLLLSSVGVREDLQGGGLGRALVEGALAGAEGDVHLYTQIPGFFAKLGFEVVSPPPGLPPRRIYGCEGCDASRCRCMVRRRTRAAGAGSAPSVAESGAEVAFESVASHLAELASIDLGPDGTTCDLSPAGLWIWRDCEAPSFARRHGNLCIRLDPHHESPYFLEPLGTGDFAESVDACLRATGRLSRVRRGALSMLSERDYDVTPIRDHFDYVCDVRKVADLRGTQHDGKRNRIRKFVREHPRHEVRALTADDRGGALSLFDRWAAGARAEATASDPPDAPALPTLVCQRRAVERAFDDFDLLGLSGCAIVEDGEVLGFVLGSRCGETVVAHFQYADATLPGIYPMLLVEACRGVFSDAVRINLEEDLGIPGLRRTKLTWHPERLIEKFEVTLRGAESRGDTRTDCHPR